jgi:uncharacterized repeat protein (TIGR03803 family)
MRTSSLLFAAAMSLSLALSPVGAATFRVIHDFCAKTGCADGSAPDSEIFIAAPGHIYGTTATGGNANSGTFFELVRDDASGKWKHTTLYSFCSAPDCMDGASPLGRLIADTSGNFYGVTYSKGGNGGSGTAWRLSQGQHGKWKLKTLYTFCTLPSCTDGFGVVGGLAYQGAQSGLPYDGRSPLYGVTLFGGGSNQGTVYELTPAHGGAWSRRTVHDFCTETAECDLQDGADPNGTLVVDAGGNLFGATQFGGPNFGGTIFRLSPAGNGTWSQTILHSFCDDFGCPDGAMPTGVVMNTDGDLLGSAQQTMGSDGTMGVSFKLDQNGAYTLSHKFCSRLDCADGRQPFSAVSIDAAGNIYGTTVSGGGNDIDKNHGGGGVLFTVSAAGKFKVLHAFCAKPSCADGAYPLAAAAPGAGGHLYGTTSRGGKFDQGVVYEVGP